MSEKDKFYIQIKPHDTIVKPQQKSVVLMDQNWDIEWSTVANVPMMIDYFALTVGHYLKEESAEGRKKIEEVWRASMIPGHARKIHYGVNMEQSTSTPPKPLQEGIYIVKIAAMSNITEGLNVESGVGIAVIKIDIAGISFDGMKETAEPGPATKQVQRPKRRAASPASGITITNDAVVRLLDLLDETDTIPPSA